MGDGLQELRRRDQRAAGRHDCRAAILELAHAQGYVTGDVTTAEIEDATPAVQVSHISSRDCKGPDATTTLCPNEATEAGGPGSIAEQLPESGVDVALGGGLTYFQQTITDGVYEGDTVVDKAEDKGYTVVTDADGLSATTPDQKVLGLFAPNNLDLELVGPQARKNITKPATRHHRRRPADVRLLRHRQEGRLAAAHRH